MYVEFNFNYVAIIAKLFENTLSVLINYPEKNSEKVKWETVFGGSKFTWSLYQNDILH